MFIKLVFVGVWILFDLAQLVAAERYLGAKQLARSGGDPRAVGPRETVAFFWSAGLLLYYGWMLVMFFRADTRPQIAVLLGVSCAGWWLRRMSPRRWVFAILTFEVAVRTGTLLSLFMALWPRG